MDNSQQKQNKSKMAISFVLRVSGLYHKVLGFYVEEEKSQNFLLKMNLSMKVIRMINDPFSVSEHLVSMIFFFFIMIKKIITYTDTISLFCSKQKIHLHLYN